jgi:glucan phosphoethanolaminetransferase (alkaline phosphatase superfamily)
MKKLTFLKLALLVLYVMVGLNILLKADVETLMQIAEEQAVILQRIILIFVFIGTLLTSLYYITLQKEQADERKKKAKSLFAMYIVVTIMALFSSDIANYIKDFI